MGECPPAPRHGLKKNLAPDYRQTLVKPTEGGKTKGKCAISTLIWGGATALLPDPAPSALRASLGTFGPSSIVMPPL